MLSADDSAPARLDSSTRWAIYWILIVCSVGVMSARLWQVQKLSYGRPVPFLSANDRSRWCTIRALGDYDTYAIDPVLQAEGGRSWDTIDKVLHWGRDNRPHFYSSKPTLLPTVLAWPYVAIRSATGLNLAEDTFPVVRWMLLLTQIVPLVAFFWAIGKIADRVARTDWTRIYLMAAATFGTYVTTFAITLNNHLPAVVCVSVALLLVLRIWRLESLNWLSFSGAGLLSGFAAANELPAASFAALALILCAIRDPLRTIFGFVPALLLVVVAFFWTNFVAHDEWRPAYSHRGDGPVLATARGEFSKTLNGGSLPPELIEPVSGLRPDLPENWAGTCRVVPGQWPHEADRRWILYFRSSHEPLIFAIPAEAGPLEIRGRANWYEYPGSYWSTANDAKSSVDRGEAMRLLYLLNLTFGHHGVFLLTPIWLLSLAGLPGLLKSERYRLFLPGLGIVVISAAVGAFYVLRPIEDRNYGGLCCTPRWLLWLAPLWLVTMIPWLDSIRDRWPYRLAALALLAASIASAFYASANPWVHPWVWQWLVGSD